MTGGGGFIGGPQNVVRVVRGGAEGGVVPDGQWMGSVPLGLELAQTTDGTDTPVPSLQLTRLTSCNECVASHSLEHLLLMFLLIFCGTWIDL